MITKLKGQNIKGQNFAHDLEKLTIFCGDNAAGKSARIDAIKLALMGYLPGICNSPSDKNNRALFGMSSGSTMGVVLDTVNGKTSFQLSEVKRSIKREWSQLQLDDMETSLVLLDQQIFFGLGATDRMKYIFSRVQIGEDYSLNGIVKTLSTLETELEFEVQEKFNEYFFGDEYEGCLMAIEEPKLYELTLQDQIQVIEANAKEWMKNAKRELKQRDESLKQLSSIMTQSDIGTHNSTDVMKEADRLKGILVKLEEPKPHVMTADEYRPTIGQFEEKIEDIESIEPDKSVFDAVEAMRASGIYLGGLKENLAALKNLLINHENEVTAQCRHIAVMDATRQGCKSRLADYMSKKSGIQNLEQCPYCKGSHEGWKVELHYEIDDKIHEAKTELEKAVKSHLDAQEVGKKMSEQALKTRDEIYNVERNIINFQAIESHEGRQKELVDLRLSLEKAKAKLQKLEETEVAEDDGSEQRKIESLKEQINQQNELLEKVMEYGASEKALAVIEKERDLIKERIGYCKDIHDKAKELKATMIAEVFENLLKSGNRIFNAVFGKTLMYENGDLYYQNGGVKVFSKTWSGSEVALGHLAMSICLAAKSEFKVVVVDELGRLTKASFKCFMESIQELIDDGVINQFIGCVPGTPVTFGSIKFIDV